MKAPRPPAIRHGRLGPGELAEVAVLGDLALVLEVIGWFAPLGSVFQALATIPFAVLAARHRVRAAVVATVAAAAVGSLVGGVGIVLQTGLAGLLGLSIGVAHRRGWSAPRSDRLHRRCGRASSRGPDGRHRCCFVRLPASQLCPGSHHLAGRAQRPRLGWAGSPPARRRRRARPGRSITGGSRCQRPRWSSSF